MVATGMPQDPKWRAPVLYLPGARPMGSTEDAEVRDRAEFNPVNQAVTQRLHRSQLSGSEIEDVLTKAGVRHADLSTWVAHYRRLGFLDDAALAERIVTTERDRKHHGRDAAMRELQRRRIDPEIAAAVLEEVFNPEVELVQATETARKRFDTLTPNSPGDLSSLTRRLSSFLQRRGYSVEVTKAAVEAVLATSR